LRSAGAGGLSLFEKTREREGNFFLYSEIAYRDFTEEDFYGLGTNSSESDHSNYRISGPSYEGVGALRFHKHFGAFVRAGYFEPELRPGLDSTIPTTQEIFNDVTAPGLDQQPNYFRFATQFFFDYRDFPGHPKSGGLLGATYAQYFDLDGGQFDFYRVTFDVRQYIPLWSEQRILALRFYTSDDNASSGSQVPFYLMQTLGGPDSLRGYPNFRFRDEKLFLIQTEYRWDPAPAVGLALFYDTGKVFPDTSDFDFSDLKRDFGFGIRLQSQEKVQVRIDIGHSKEGTQFFFKLDTSF
jgi:outer membrane protein assembly factor BamA